MVLVFAGYLLFAPGRGPEVGVPVGEQLEGVAPTEQVIPSGKEVVVTYTAQGFAPNPVTINRGDSVLFMNRGEAEMWPASAVHPTHSAYPTTGGCIGSTFDACRGIGSGNGWAFQFDIPGTWKYHNHLSTNHVGTVIVNE